MRSLRRRRPPGPVRSARTSVALPLALALAAAAAPARADFTFLDPRFSAETVVDLDDWSPVGLAWLPDGRMLVWERCGAVRVVEEGVVLPTPFVDLTGRVNCAGDRGLLGLAVDPDFATNGAVYLLYVLESGDPPDPFSDQARTARLTRVTADPENPAVALAESEIVLLGTVGTPPCSAHPAGADCIPDDSVMHTIGSVRVAPDGMLFVGNGDGASPFGVDSLALRSQDLGSLAGKVLRIRKDGTAPADNPFYDGTDSIPSKIWAYGLRNPFRFTLDPELGEPLLGDVGWNHWEEIDRGRGANFGWPCYEGVGPQPTYQNAFAACRALAAESVTPPIHAYNRAIGGTVIVGPVVTSPLYPQEVRDRLLFGDYAYGWLAFAELGPGGVASVTRIAEASEKPVAIEQGPDGYLYYVDLPTGRVRRLRPPGLVARAEGEPLFGQSPLTVDFSSEGSGSTEATPFTLEWDFGDGLSSAASEPVHVFTSPVPAAFDVALTVADGESPPAVARLRVVVGSTPPVVAISKPKARREPVRPFTILEFAGSATDPEEGPLPAGGLHWTVLHRHDDHQHGWLELDGAGGSFRVPDFGEEDHAFELRLTATDSTGLANVAVVVVPIEATLFADDFEYGQLAKWNPTQP